MAKMIINYWGDVMCPFCYIGEHLLSEVLSDCDFADDVEVRWQSCLLNSTMPTDKVESFVGHLQEAYEPQEVEKKLNVLKHLAEKYHLTYGLDKAKVVSSNDAARLLKLATEQGITLPVAKALGKAFFSDGLNVADHQTLIDIVTGAGLTLDRVTEVLQGSDYQKEIEEDQLRAGAYCPQFIPTLYFDHAYMIDGVLKREEIEKSLTTAYQAFVKKRQAIADIDLPMMGLDSCGVSCDIEPK